MVKSKKLQPLYSRIEQFELRKRDQLGTCRVSPGSTQLQHYPQKTILGRVLLRKQPIWWAPPISSLATESLMPLEFSHDEPATLESTQRASQLLEDQQWYADHSQELHDRFACFFVSVAGGEPFAAATREEAYALAKQRQPDREPIVFFLPKERKLSVYDLSRSL